MAKILGGVLVATALFSVGIVAPAQAAATAVNCTAPTKLRAIIAETGLTSFTNSQTFRNIPQTLVSFTQGGAVASCVIVRFSAEAGANGAGFIMEVRAILDGVTEALPISVRFGEGTEVARFYEFIFKQVAPGAHTLRMQFRSNNGVSTFVSNRTTVVLYAP